MAWLVQDFAMHSSKVSGAKHIDIATFPGTKDIQRPISQTVCVLLFLISKKFLLLKK